MNPILNPYNPGAGTPPTELAGRDELREKVRVCIERLRIGNTAKSVLLVGLRGVGKTVLLDQMRSDAEETGIHTVRIEAPENRSLPALLAPALRVALLRLSQIESAKALAQKSLRALAGFAKALKFKFQDIEVGIDFEPEKGLADNGDLEGDLTSLFVATGQAAKAANTVLAIFIDELQYVNQNEFAALISALHRCTQLKLPLTVVGAGLPQLLGLAGKAKSYAERLFDYPIIDKLDKFAAEAAIRKPAQHLNVDYEDAAVAGIIAHTQGYPYFLQEWGKHAWDLAQTSPITADVVERASKITIAALDESFFRVRLDRTTPSEKRYLRAMAELGPGPHRSGDIAQHMNKKAQSFGPVRSALISKGIVWSPIHGDTAFTVPLFHEYLLRTVPPGI
jgi:AAA ATPase domain